MSIANTANQLFKLMGEPPIPRMERVEGYTIGFSPAFMAQHEADMARWAEEDRVKAEREQKK